jgi:hypothetical protein
VVAADTEISVVDDGVVEHDEQRDEGARAVERNDAISCCRDLAAVGCFQHRRQLPVGRVGVAEIICSQLMAPAQSGTPYPLPPSFPGAPLGASPE